MIKACHFFFTFNALQLNPQALLMSITLHHYMVSTCSSLPIGKKLGHWVKLCSIVWFDYFLLIEYKYQVDPTFSNVKGDCFEHL